MNNLLGIGLNISNVRSALEVVTEYILSTDTQETPPQKIVDNIFFILEKAKDEIIEAETAIYNNS